MRSERNRSISTGHARAGSLEVLSGAEGAVHRSRSGRGRAHATRSAPVAPLARSGLLGSRGKRRAGRRPRFVGRACPIFFTQFFLLDGFGGASRSTARLVSSIPLRSAQRRADVLSRTSDRKRCAAWANCVFAAHG